MPSLAQKRYTNTKWYLSLVEISNALLVHNHKKYFLRKPQEVFFQNDPFAICCNQFLNVQRFLLFLLIHSRQREQKINANARRGVLK